MCGACFWDIGCNWLSDKIVLLSSDKDTVCNLVQLTCCEVVKSSGLASNEVSGDIQLRVMFR